MNEKDYPYLLGRSEGEITLLKQKLKAAEERAERAEAHLGGIPVQREMEAERVIEELLPFAKEHLDFAFSEECESAIERAKSFLGELV